METHASLLPTTLIVLRHSPHCGRWLAEGLDLALVSAVFGQEVKLLFMGQGIFGLIPNQHDAVGQPLSTSAVLDTVGMYGINELLVPKSDLISLGIDQNDLMVDVSVIDDAKVRAYLANAGHVLTF
ncbi:DsrE family protein [Vreelandella aquamarina]|uniref:DsrE family protein n=1 Tax=Vreelandella aquamarina TaxID=77097 RepID=UPI00384A7DB9